MVSSASHDSSPPEDFSQTWEILSEKVGALVDAWESGGGPPDLRQFVPEGAGRVRRMALGELIKVDLEYRWQRSQPQGHPDDTAQGGATLPSIPRRDLLLENYAEQFPELAEGGLPCDLIYEEYHIRRQAGDDVTAEEYFERFPKQSDELRRLLGLESPEKTTALFGSNSIPQVDVGEKIDDFDLLTELGKGAFATVFLARQQSMQRLVALKVSSDRGNEPQTMAQLDHPNIVRVYDQRLVPERKLRLLYMQYVPGGTMQSVVKFIRQFPPTERSGKHLLGVIDGTLAQRGESPPEESLSRKRYAASTWPETVCRLGARLAAALDYAHRQGILHRDIKPANVLLAADATPKLVDFNISFSSKLDGAAPAAYFGGSLAYMAPEQLDACNPKHACQPEELDARCDIYSLGVLLWELLTGTRPYLEEGLDGSWQQILESMVRQRAQGIDAATLAKLPPNCPQGLDQVLVTCLAPNREDRFSTAGELARQLELCLKPKVQRLLRPPKRSWRTVARRHPILALMGAAVVTNLVVSIPNIIYNYFDIIKRLTVEAREVFLNVQLYVVNGVLYPVGVGLGVFFAWSLISTLIRLNHNEKPPPERIRQARRRSLSIGSIVAAITFVLWVISGIVFPVGLYFLVQGETNLQFYHYVHFMISQVLCGMIATTLCFFTMNAVTVRAFYPMLIQPDSLDGHEMERLTWLYRRTWFHFGLAVLVPITSVTMLAFIEADLRLAYILLGGLGVFVGFITFGLLRWIQADLEAMAMAVSPTGESLSIRSDTFDTSS